jgi:acyl-coenzyme A thioesterase PaaI-like protein
VSNKAEIIEFLAREFPQNTCAVEEVGKASAVVKQRIGADELRPGGTVSGPVLTGVADLALYVALLGHRLRARAPCSDAGDA